MKNKLAFVLVAVLASAGLLIVIGSAIADVDIGTFTKAISDSSSELTAKLDKTEVKRGDSVNVSGAASVTNVVDIVVLGPRGLRRRPASITSEEALVDGIRFMTVAVTKDNTFNAEIRISEDIYSGFQHVMVLSPDEDGVYGATSRTGGELFDAMQDYIATKGGNEAVLPGKSTEQLVDIIAAATFNATGSDDLVVDSTFIGASSFGEVMKLNPIAPVMRGEPLEVYGTAEREDGSVMVVSTIPDPLYLAAVTVRVEEGAFSATFDTTDAVPGTYVMQAEDTEGNIDTEPFEVLSSAHATTEQRIGRIKAVEHSAVGVLFDIPYRVVSGETMYVKGYTTARGNLDIVIDNILMADDLIIDQHGEFEFDLNTRKPLLNLGAYTPGVSVIKAYSNCHVAGVSVGDHVRTAYKHLEPDGVCAFLFVAPEVTVEMNLNGVAKGEHITVLGTARGTDIVDIVIIGPEGLKKMPGSFASEDAIADGLFFTSAEVSKRDNTFEKSMRIPEGTDSGSYQLLILTPGRDGLYALTMREEGDLFDALMDYGWSVNDFVGRNQAQVREMLEEVTFSSPGSDDIAAILQFNVEYRTWYVDDDLKDYPDANFTKIQDAVNASSDGDVIIVYNGTYVENVDVNKSITIVSASGAENTIVQAKNSNDHVFEVTADYVNISGFTVQNASSWWTAGIYLDSADYCNISYNNVSNNYRGIILRSSSNNDIFNNRATNNHLYGISLSSSNKNRIANNKALNNNYGIKLGRSCNNIISNNNASSNGWGIYFDESDNNNLTNNIVNSNNNCGVRLDSSCKNNIKNNVFVDYGLIVYNSYQNTVKNNTIDDKPLVYLENESDILVTNAGQVILVNCNNTTVESLNLSNAGVGIELLGTNNSKILDNKVLNNERGIELCDSCNNILRNNNLSNNYCGIDLWWHSYNNTISNNKALNNRYGLTLDGANNNTIINNIVLNSYCGIDLWASHNNIYLNNFVNNSHSVGFYNYTNLWNSTSKITYTYKGKTYTNYLGNYWDDYTDVDANNDGIWDHPYPIDLDKDYHPLVEPFENYEEKWSFAIITDLHIGYGIPDYGMEGWDDDLTRDPKLDEYYLTERLRSVVNWINGNISKYNIKFVAVLGDVTDTAEKSEFLKVKGILDELDLPYFPIAGNHDVCPYIQRPGETYPLIDRIRYETEGEISREYFREVFNDTFFEEQFDNLGTSWDPQLDSSFFNYAFKYKGIKFVCLDTTTDEHAILYFAGVKPGGKLSEETKRFLENDLPGEEPVVIFSHHPFYFDPSHQYAFNSSHISDFYEIIRQSNARVLANFAGHVHKSDVIYNPNIGEDAFVVITEDIMEESSEVVRIVNVRGKALDFFTKKPEEGVLKPAINLRISFNPKNVSVGKPIHFKAKAKSFLFGLTYEWDFNGDGVIDSTDDDPFYTYETPGNYIVSLTITDNGNKERVWQRINVSSTAPEPRKIKIKEGLLPVLAYEGMDVSEVAQNTPELVTIMKTSSELKPVADFLVHFENATEDIDLSNLTADVNLTTRKSIIYMHSWPSVIEPSKILYIPSTGKGAVYICENATSLDEVSVENADVVINVGETKEGITVVTTLYNDTEYYIVFNVTGTGGGEFTPTENIFDTSSPANPYPSIFGTHNGTIKPNQTITVSTLYTYPCSGTGGHSEYMKIRNKSDWNVTARWEGYSGDWRNISFNKNFTLEEGETYNYTIRTGSYPQIHPTDNLSTPAGFITCSEFVDANGKRYKEGIPAIKLE